MQDDEKLGGDLVEGAKGIALFLFGDDSAKSVNRVYYLADPKRGNAGLPVFRLGGILCGRKSTMRAFIEAQEKAALAKAV